MYTWNAVIYNLLKQTLISTGKSSEVSDCILNTLILLNPDPSKMNYQDVGNLSTNCLNPPQFNKIIPNTWNSDTENQIKIALFQNDPVPTAEKVQCALNFLKKTYSNPNDAISFLVQDATKNKGNLTILKCPMPIIEKVLIGGGIVIGILLILLVIVLIVKNTRS